MSALDKEFAAALQTKIDEAAKLLREVNSSLEEVGESFIDMTQDYCYHNEDEEPKASLDFDAIISVLDAGGWMTSSMSC